MFTFKIIKSSVNSAQLSQRQISIASGRCLGFFKDKAKDETTEVAPVIDQQDDEVDHDVQMRRIDEIRNKSGLLPQHRNILHGTVPYVKPQSWVHNTLKYQRKIYGKFGAESGVDPRICFWSPTELKEKEEYERVSFPKTVPEMMAVAEQEKRERRENIIAREEQIAKNLEKLEQWKKDIEMRKEKKETVRNCENNSATIFLNLNFNFSGSTSRQRTQRSPH